MDEKTVTDIPEEITEVAAEVAEEIVAPEEPAEVMEIVEEPVEAVADIKEEAEEAVAEPIMVTDTESAFAAILARDGEDALKNGESLINAFSAVAPQLVRESRLVRIFALCEGGKTLSETKDAAPVVEMMKKEYWIAEDAAKMICDAFISAVFGEEEVEESLYDVANRYYSGNGVALDKEKAAELFEQAALEGDMDAQYTLGYMLDKGDGVEKDREAALRWYEMAAEQGHESAQNRVAVLRRAQAQPEAPKKRGFFGR